jgi:hypothetical protein
MASQIMSRFKLLAAGRLDPKNADNITANSALKHA